MNIQDVCTDANILTTYIHTYIQQTFLSFISMSSRSLIEYSSVSAVVIGGGDTLLIKATNSSKKRLKWLSKPV